MEELRSTLSTKNILFWCCTIGALVTLPFMMVNNHEFFPISWQGWLLLVGLALVCQVIGQGLIVYSLSQLSAGIVAITMLLDPVFAGFLAWLILHEEVSILNGVSCVTVLLGIYLAISSKYSFKET
jgi:drug/metabolite transporter (DMT)-like permease